MLGLIIKDFFNIKKTAPLFFTLGALMSIFFIVTKKHIFIPITAILMFSIMGTSTFFMDEKVQWNKLADTFPISKSCIVQSKYIFYFFIISLIIPISFILSIPLLNISDFTIMRISSIIAITIDISLLSGGIFMAILYCVRKCENLTEIACVFSYVISSFSVIGIYKFLKTFLLKNDLPEFLVLLTSFLLVCIIYVILYFISAFFYSRKKRL